MAAEEIQKYIDHYGAVATAEKELGRMEQWWYYMGKRDAYCNLLEKMYPEIEDRVFPLDEKARQETIEMVKGWTKYK